ncbi:putative sister chromatid cohesion protein Ctf8 [Lineolata rhizophorae]|uniref:Putative sister chromatid cohesion protein Ctf8 n=1 Tax=Lineolata rhizophorae TaxID=578093 RepID=A0A6A6P9D8_9PEZI|nr:putative sister chromatid cohesion protein Ctf8 [Lineolata rhizophorae]
MPSVPLHPPQGPASGLSTSNPLPKLLQTPTGLAIVEIQGTINMPPPDEDEEPSPDSSQHVGRLVFPAYSPGNPEDTAWMKRVYLYIGENQRMTGEVKKLPKPLAVIRKREEGGEESQSQAAREELEIVEIVRHKILFAHRPEPVSQE